MTISAEFTVNGNANPAAHSVSYGSTVNLELLSYVGSTSIVWSIESCSDISEPIPTITRSGTPEGRFASFVMPADSGDGYGRSFLIKCTVSSEIIDADGVRLTSVKYGVVGAQNIRGILPISPGEENYRHGTHGWGPEVNIALKNTSSSGTGDVLGPATAVADNIVIFNGTSGDVIKDSGKSFSQLIHANGSVAFTADQSMGTHKITGLSNGTVSTDAVNKGQLDTATSSITSVTTDRLLGRDTAGTGAVEQITVSGGLEFTGSTGMQRSAISGDVTIAAGSTTSAITAGVIVDADVNASAAIAHTKLATIATDSLLGRDTAGTGTLEPITLNSTLEFNGSGSIQRAALTGDVTASAGSNVTSIASNVIVDADINSAANIAWSKFSTSIGNLGFTGLKHITYTEHDNGDSTSAAVINWSTNGQVQKIKLTANCTGTFTAPPGACTIQLKLVQDEVGSRTFTWPSNVIWPNNTPPTLSTTPFDTDIISLFWDLSNYYGETNEVSLSSLPDVATATLLGRTTAGTGPPESLTLDPTLVFSGSTLQRAALTGDVTAAAGSNTTAIAAGVIIDADINSSAAIAVSKLAPSGTNGRVLVTSSGVPAWGFAIGNSTDAFTYNGLTHTLQVAGTTRLELSSTVLKASVPSISFAADQINPVFGFFTRTTAGTSETLRFEGQANSSTGGAVGGAVSMTAGSATGASGSRVGGAFSIASGTGANGDGNVLISRGVSLFIELANVSSGKVLSLMRTSGSLTSTQMPADTGDGVIYIADATTAPTVKPIGGSILFNHTLGLSAMGVGGVESTIASAGSGTARTRKFVDIKKQGSASVTTGAGAVTLVTLTADDISAAAFADGTVMVSVKAIARSGSGSNYTYVLEGRATVVLGVGGFVSVKHSLSAIHGLVDQTANEGPLWGLNVTSNELRFTADASDRDMICFAVVRLDGDTDS